MRASALLFPAVMIGAFYLLLLRPQQRRMRNQQQLLTSLVPGDEIVTIGGLHGRIQSLDDSMVWLKVAPGVVLKFSRQAIRSKVEPEVEEPAAAEQAEGS